MNITGAILSNMKNILIGSRALVYWNPEFQVKESTDWDIISNNPIEGAEWHKPDKLLNYKFESLISDRAINFNGHTVWILKPVGLSIIKRSHLWRDLSFSKHITHYHKYMSQWHNFNPDEQTLYEKRLKATKTDYPQNHPKLNVTVEDFFDDYVTKKYEHDWLHELFAYHDKPLYTRLQTDSSVAWCNYDKWLDLSYTERLECIAEETQVIATERFLVPKEFNYPIKLAYMKALNKVCTTLCSGWFRDSAIDHYPELINMFDENRFNKVKEILNDQG
jgi:hypothetical protein